MKILVNSAFSAAQHIRWLRSKDSYELVTINYIPASHVLLLLEFNQDVSVLTLHGRDFKVT